MNAKFAGNLSWYQMWTRRMRGWKAPRYASVEKSHQKHLHALHKALWKHHQQPYFHLYGTISLRLISLNLYYFFEKRTSFVILNRLGYKTCQNKEMELSILVELYNSNSEEPAETSTLPSLKGPFTCPRFSLLTKTIKRFSCAFVFR